MTRRLLRLSAIAAVLGLAGLGCSRDATSRAAPPPEPSAEQATTASARAGQQPSRRPGTGSVGRDTLPPSDSIVPLAPPGVLADAFPEPSRPVAEIISSKWSDEASRDKAGEATKVMSALGVREGMTVADIGAGSGYYTVRLSRKLGPSGRVIAQDIQKSYLEELRARVRRERLPNVVLALGDPHDPRLPPNAVDVALLVHMYHEVEQPYGLLYNLYPALKSGARIGVVDLDRPTSRHGTPKALLRCELAAVGYRFMSMHELGKGSGYLAVFAPPATPAELTTPAAVEACPAA